MAAIVSNSTYGLLLRQRSQGFRQCRTNLKELVNAPIAVDGSTAPDGFKALQEPLVYLANTFSRYAGNQETVYDNGSSSSSSAGIASPLERQVERAITQVLGRSTGRNPESFVRALQDAFPTKADGQISFTPSRSTLSLYGGSSSMSGAIGTGLSGQISAEQSTLYRQSSIIAADAIKVLSGLQPFTPVADLDRVEALRALVKSQITSLVDEFGRPDTPRAQRVDTYFDALKGPNGFLGQFGRSALLERSLATPTTTADESQVAGYELLKNYIDTLEATWNRYLAQTDPNQPVNVLLFSERLARASVLLSAVAGSNASFIAAMDSVGFTEQERRSNAAKFTTMGTDEPELPDITVNDLNDWLDRFATMEGPYLLADSGQYGLDFVTNQADKLYLVVVPILTHIRTARSLNLNSMSLLAKVLLHERVSWSLDELLEQLKALADLAA
jgi:hypothetical protein